MTTRSDAVHCIVGLSLPNCSRHWWVPIFLFAVVGFAVGLSLLLAGLSARVQDAYASLWSVQKRVVNLTDVWNILEF
jgi:ABC-type polysaccharide/polyol phosphate export permease